MEPEVLWSDCRNFFIKFLMNLREGKEPKDDDSEAGAICYDVLFLLFVILGALGFYNTWLACKIKKFSNKSILGFYLSAQAVILLRCFLFTDQWLSY